MAKKKRMKQYPKTVMAARDPVVSSLLKHYPGSALVYGDGDSVLVQFPTGADVNKISRIIDGTVSLTPQLKREDVQEEEGKKTVHLSYKLGAN